MSMIAYLQMLSLWGIWCAIACAAAQAQAQASQWSPKGPWSASTVKAPLPAHLCSSGVAHVNARSSMCGACEDVKCGGKLLGAKPVQSAWLVDTWDKKSQQCHACAINVSLDGWFPACI